VAVALEIVQEIRDLDDPQQKGIFLGVDLLSLDLFERDVADGRLIFPQYSAWMLGYRTRSTCRKG
jgi:hypothetical protein